MGNSRRQAIRLAAELSNNVILWMEPEKESFILQIDLLVKELQKNNVDFVIPKRKSLLTYPFVQQQTESLGNLFWKELTHTDLDMYFGPRMWKKEVTDYFLKYDGQYGDVWDATFIPVMNAIIDRKKVISTEIDYIHPSEQTEQEQHNLDFHRKRFTQLDKVSTALFEHWNTFHK